MHRKLMMSTSRWILRKPYEVTGTQKKIDAYKLMDSQKTREYETTGAQRKSDVYRLMDSRKIDE